MDFQEELSKALDALAAAPPAPAALVTAPPVARMLRQPEVSARVGLSRSTIWRLARQGSFPAPRRLGPSSVRWLAEEGRGVGEEPAGG